MPAKHELEHVDAETPDLREELLTRLRDAVPEAFVDGKLDLDRLAELAGDAVETAPERYGLTWPGKREAIAMLQAPSRATLAPDRDESENFNGAPHVFIEGENLEVLKLLYRSYFGRVKLIYVDPPYNTGKDFIYPDNFADPLGLYLRMTGQTSEEGDLQTSKPDLGGRKHSGWLSMLYPRMALCRQFLTEDGVVFVSIDDIELSNLLRLMDEVYGEENRVGVICWRNVTDNNPTLINKDNEYIVCYARSKKSLPEIWRSHESDEKNVLLDFYRSQYEEGHCSNQIEKSLKEFLKENAESLAFLTRYNRVDEHGIYTGSESVHNPRAGGYDFEVIHPVTGKAMRKPANGYRFPEQTFRALEADGKIIYGKDEKRIVKIKKYLEDYEDSLRSLIVMDGRLGSYDLKRAFGTEESLFDNPKPVDLVFRLISFATASSDLVLDLFAGAGTTGEAVARMNNRDNGARRAILIQLPEEVAEDKPAYKAGYATIAALGRARVRKAIVAGNASAGLRSFRLVPSNLRRWSGVANQTAETYETQLEAFIDSLEPGWKSEDVIWEVALREGLELTAKVEQIEENGPVFFRVSDEEREKAFTICLEDSLTLNAVKALGLQKDDLFVCRATALDDTLAANLALQCRLKVL